MMMVTVTLTSAALAALGAGGTALSFALGPLSGEAGAS